ncbi:Hypothetical predicted protein [Mytilus galloprovincialis]|uniref:Uncharacterized protein n=1 Tax=Mytilus galloprovincialis TaxID=29158 RepID=A0A8B6HB26_MYTGA|nr:Hypothetical predicted protein [Mytilus galloprovincialis]
MEKNLEHSMTMEKKVETNTGMEKKPGTIAGTKRKSGKGTGIKIKLGTSTGTNKKLGTTTGNKKKKFGTSTDRDQKLAPSEGTGMFIYNSNEHSGSKTDLDKGELDNKKATKPHHGNDSLQSTTDTDSKRPVQTDISLDSYEYVKNLIEKLSQEIFDKFGIIKLYTNYWRTIVTVNHNPSAFHEFITTVFSSFHFRHRLLDYTVMQNFPAMATRGLSLVVRRVFLHHKKLVKSSSLHRIVQFEPACPCSYYCTTALFKDEATVVYRDGLPVFSVPLPSRRQSCEFTMKPVTHTVGKFLSFLKEEDGGIDRAAIFTEGKLKFDRE